MDAKTASLFRNGRNQALRIPRGFELPGTRARIRRLPNGNLEIEALDETGLLAAFRDAPPLPPEDWMEPVRDIPSEPVDL
ncbi:MAG: AbrB/MazE/SpoVT family DNA-binding domain-containing protein [Parafilimonas terrae]|nr:AbrB/MazE/SpoVT family DNA-binding domain-containing protein [Parafilimonas terrae]